MTTWLASDLAQGANDGSATRLIGAPRGLSAENEARGSVVARFTQIMDHGSVVLLMLATGALVIRPTDIVPAFAGLALYEACVTACFLAAVPRILNQLRNSPQVANAITLFLLMLIPAIVLSHLWKGDTWAARIDSWEMIKACVMLMLVVCVMDTATRLRGMVIALLVSVVGVAVLAIAEFHGIADLPSLTGVVQHSVEPGERGSIVRLRGTGIFNDPNDFALILVSALCACAYLLDHHRGSIARWLMLLPMALLGYAFYLTQSRGGLISGVAAAGAISLARLGWRNTLALSLLAAPVLMAPIWGRQNTLNISNSDDTFQSRLELWSASLDAFRSGPMFGTGRGSLTELIGQVTHNSFLHAFAELGVLGGCVFLGAFYFLLRGIWQSSPADPAVARLKPYVFAIVAGYAVGLLTLSRCYTVPTQMLLGVGIAFLLVAARSGRDTIPRVTLANLGRLAFVSGGFLSATYVFVRLLLNR